MLTAYDRYLKLGGDSIAVLRPSTMFSEIASSGMRRLKTAENGIELNLHRVRTFGDLRLFASAKTNAITWQVKKGEPTVFPVEVLHAKRVDRSRWQPDSSDRLAEVKARVIESVLLAKPSGLNNESRWMVTERVNIRDFDSLKGSNCLIPRMGVFTGGGNSVFYAQALSERKHTLLCRNIVERAKRASPQMQFEIEKGMVAPVVRGRDIQMWHYESEVWLVFPHTVKSGMYPVPRAELEESYPMCLKYLEDMRPILEDRKGFAGWEKKIHEQNFYTLQRVGPYTFAPYKVCWRYIAAEFTVCVVAEGANGAPLVPNDKVMFIPFERKNEAYFVAGVLSSKITREYVNSLIEKRQISTRLSKNIHVPEFDEQNCLHEEIAAICEEGHLLLASNSFCCIDNLRQRLDDRVAQLFADRQARSAKHTHLQAPN